MRLSLFVAAAALFSASFAAHADTVVPFYLNTSLANGGTITGDVNIDIDASNSNQFGSTADLTYSIDGSVFTVSGSSQGFDANPSNSWVMLGFGSGMYIINLELPTTSLASFTGGLCTNSETCDGHRSRLIIVDGNTSTYADSGTLTEIAATPEPSSLVLFGTGLLGFAGAVRRRFV